MMVIALKTANKTQLASGVCPPQAGAAAGYSMRVDRHSCLADSVAEIDSMIFVAVVKHAGPSKQSKHYSFASICIPHTALTRQKT
jgi:hypothetical protein